MHFRRLKDRFDRGAVRQDDRNLARTISSMCCVGRLGHIRVFQQGRRFGRIARSQFPAEQVVRILNTYFDTIVKEIIAVDGYVDKFIGDAVMAVFRGEYHLDRAIDAALAIREAIGKLPEEAGTDYRPLVSIGINSGEMVSGNIGSASLKRLDYTVIGDTVNVAARLQDKAGANQILIADPCYQRVKESFKCNPLGEVSFKNKAEAVTVYEVLE